MSAQAARDAQAPAAAPASVSAPAAASVVAQDATDAVQTAAGAAQAAAPAVSPATAESAPAAPHAGTAPGTVAGPPAGAASPPIRGASFASVVQRGATRNKSSNRPAPSRFAFTRPSHEDMVAMMALYDNGADHATILNRHLEITPQAADAFPFSVELDGGEALANVGATAVAGSFYEDHGNAKVAELLRSGLIGVVDRSPDGAITIGARTLEAKAALTGLSVTVLGHTLKFRNAHALDTCHFVDLFGVRASSTKQIFQGLVALGARPIHCDRRRSPSGALTTVRVSFHSKSVPPSLLVDGKPADQFVLDGTLYPVRHCNTPASQPQSSYVRKSKRAINLTPRVSPPAEEAGVASDGTPADAGAASDALAPAKPDAGTDGGNASSKSPETGGSASSSKRQGSPGSSDGFIAPKRKGGSKRSRSASQQQSPVLEDWCSTNFFDALYQLDAGFDAMKTDVEDDHAAHQYRVFPSSVSHPMTTNLDDVWFKKITREGTTAVRASTKIGGKKMLAKMKEVIASPPALTVLDKPPTEEIHAAVEAMVRSPDPGSILASVVQTPAASMKVMMDCLINDSDALADMVDLHVLQRLVQVAEPESCHPFETASAKLDLPEQRADRLVAVRQHLAEHGDVQLVSTTRALALFELLLLAAAPFARQDLWLQVLCGVPVQWVGADPVRLLSVDLLHQLLQSTTGQGILQRCYSLNTTPESWSTPSWNSARAHWQSRQSTTTSSWCQRLVAPRWWRAHSTPSCR